MKKNLKLLLLFYLFGMGFLYLNAQSVISSAGGNFNNDKAMIQWTLGENTVETINNNDHVLTQGYNQPTIEVKALATNDKNDFNCNVYPNPTNDYLVIDLKYKEVANTSFELLNPDGKRILQDELSQTLNYLSLKNIPAGYYLLKIHDQNQKSQIFKIIKTN